TINVQNAAPVPAPSSFDIWYANASDDNVLDNATDADNDLLTAVQVGDNPQYASSFQLNPGGTFAYSRAVAGPLASSVYDSFSYRAFDGTVYSDPVTVSLRITDAPIAKDV